MLKSHILTEWKNLFFSVNYQNFIKIKKKFNWESFRLALNKDNVFQCSDLRTVVSVS
jgi:hypothetical protein